MPLCFCFNSNCIRENQVERYADVDLDKLAATKEIAENIVQISEAANRLLSSGLKKRALIVLIKDEIKVPLHQIEKVLDILPLLSDLYLEKPNAKASKGRS